MSVERNRPRVEGPFDVCGPLPTGTIVLEASAGTGKTYTIAALAARYIADGLADLDQLMLITFGRMATNELRMRVRERLVHLERHLAAAISGRATRVDEPDEVSDLLTRGEPELLQSRHRNISRALADFDAATIATTHEFCQQMLAGLGVLGDREPDAVFVESLSELTREVTGDCYLQRYAGADVPPPFSYDEALRIANDVVNNVSSRLVPDGADGEAAQRVQFGEQVRAKVQHRKELGRLFTYEDMLSRLQQVLADPLHGAAAAQRLRDRYQIVLVDEFQDTDPTQWDILRRAFHGYTTLILIGDPKQAIYAFRGADVFSYLDATHEADSTRTLDTNWRSDKALVDALDALMGGAALGDPGIVVRPVQAHHSQRRMTTGGDISDAPVRLRVIGRDRQAEKLPSVRDLRPKITNDLVADIAAVLSSGASLEVAPDESPRPLKPSDIAVLVRRNDSGEQIRAALSEAGIPAVLMGASSVFASTMATEWLTLLRALEVPRQALVRDASLTCFFGWTFIRLAEADDEELTDLTQTLRLWSRILNHQGVAALVEAVTSHTRLSERLLSRVGGERQLTDLRHIGQSLHAAMVSGSLGVTALVEWLRLRMAEAQLNSLNDRTRRLETDADAVQILTVHRSKGQEFPVVYLPEAWDRYVDDRDQGVTLRLHLDNERVLDVGGNSGPGRPDRLLRYRAEDAGEELRLLYVALTRAKCQVITWWAPSRNTPNSSLHRFLFGPRRDAVEPAPAYEVHDEPSVLSHLYAAGFSIETVQERSPVAWHNGSEQPAELRARRFDRALDLLWRRTSYSALTAAAHGRDMATGGGGVTSEAAPAKEDDESAVASPTTKPLVGEVGFDIVSPMNDLPSGAQFGTIVHAVFEGVDPHAADLAAEVRRCVADELLRSPSGPLTVDALTAALLPCLTTPLGPLAGNQRLCDIAVADRLAELDFEFALAGGEHPSAAIALADLAPLLRRYLPADDPLASYPDLIEHPLLAGQPLRGYLNGSIDAVLRFRSADGTPRYVVVDYKTNWLGDFNGEPLTLGHYAPRLLADAMMRAQYPLQALLYSVAVHRFLRWRQPGYQPELHLGGVLYLFVRGMAGPKTPRVDGVPAGVFGWHPPADLIVELSHLLDRGPR